MQQTLDRPMTTLLRQLDQIDPAQANTCLRDLMAEAGVKNHVRVMVHRALPVGGAVRWPRGRAELVHDNRTDGGQTLARPADFVMLDSVRMLHGLKPIWLDKAVQDLGGELRSVTPNLRTTVGIDYVASALGDSSGSRAAVAQYIAVTNNTSAPAVGDTATTTAAASLDWGTASATDAAASNSRGEYTALGVQRKLATYAHTTSTANYTMAVTYQATGTVTALQACGLFNNASQGAGTLFVENTFTATSLATNDQLTLTWTISI